MKQIYIVCITFMIINNIYSQGWIGNTSNQSLYAVDVNGNPSYVNVGIGTNSPTDQFHTIGSVRFQGLTQNSSITQILGQDINGRLYWKSISEFNNGNFWSLSGNTSTNPTTNFLGTIDQQHLSIRTNSIERMRVLSTGL